MLPEFSPVTMFADKRNLHDLPRAEKPLIKILLYTDDPREIVAGPSTSFGLGQMINHLNGHAPAFARLEIKWRSRYPTEKAQPVDKINDILKEEAQTGHPFDQIWLFGLHQVNKESFTLGVNGGGPDSELDADEISCLRKWMDRGGGVLITGDHASLEPLDSLTPDPNAPCPDTFRLDPENKKQTRFLGLGRALGRCVPRAGEMRDWEGPPTASREASNNTQTMTFTPSSGNFEDERLFQRDHIPQQLILQPFDEKGQPARFGQPHPLFLYSQDRTIQFFPDHLHEGAVAIPNIDDEDLWGEKTKAFRPEPRVVAFGLDKRDGRKLDLIATYDGDAIGVGRIVADSTWHHYFNVNLHRFTHPARKNSAADQIGQFYGNLAVWLSSSQKRFEMADAMFAWLARQPILLEERGPRLLNQERDILRIGEIARHLLLQVAAPCEVHELLQVTVPSPYREPNEALYLSESGFDLSHLPSKELLLGHVINQYPWEWVEKLQLPFSNEERRKKVRAAFIAGSEQAFEMNLSKITASAMFARTFMAQANLKTLQLSEREASERGFEASLNVDQTSERRSTMAACEDKNWEMTLVVETKSPPEVEIIFFDKVEIRDGIITGMVIDEIGDPLSNLRGTCTPFEGAGEPDVSLMSFLFRLKGSDGKEVGVSLCGFAYQPPGAGAKPKFHGRFRAFAPDSGLPPAGDAQLKAIALGTDPGDTGTGTGQQT